MKKIVYLRLPATLLILTFWMACKDNTFKQFAPLRLEFSSVARPKAAPKLLDSLKNKMKNEYLNRAWHFSIFVRDPEEAGVYYLKYSLSGGTGVLTRNGKDITDGTVQDVPSETKVDFQFRPNGTNAVFKLSFTAISKYGVAGETFVVTLVVFENAPPRAGFVIKAGNDGAYSRILDAGASRDSDEKSGGTILTYEYAIMRNNVSLKTIRSYDVTSKTTPVVFPGPGTYLLTLKVYDNDGAASSPVSKTEVVK